MSGKINPLSQRQIAKRLGVHFVHLNLVLKGHRISKRLTDKYNSVIAEARKGASK